MSYMDRLLAHPLNGLPYDKISFTGFNQDRIALYTVEGTNDAPVRGYDALRRAFERWGGRCFYCNTRFARQSFSNRTVGRDHVLARSKGGSDLLHNLVIACRPCDRIKANDLIHEFRPKSAKEYLAALENHIATSIEKSGGKRN